MIELAKLNYSPLGKAFEKQIKTIVDLWQKRVVVLKDLKLRKQTKSIEEIFPEGYESVKIKNKINKIKEYEKKLDRNSMIYDSSKEPFDFRMFKTIRSFGYDIYSSKITTNEADQAQSDLVEYIIILKIQMIRKKQKKKFLILQKIFMTVEN